MDRITQRKNTPRHFPWLGVLIASVVGGMVWALFVGGGSGHPAASTVGRIVRVADGDTVTVEIGGGERVKVRLLGIDAPESSALRRGHAECGGQAAKALMTSLAAEHPSVMLQSDPSQDAVDRYGRRLAYVVPVGGGPSFQEQLLQAGWAQVYVFRAASPPARTSRFRAAAANARSDRRGVWEACGGRFTEPLEGSSR